MMNLRIKMAGVISEQKRGSPLCWQAASLGLCSSILLISYCQYLLIFLIYSWYIPYIYIYIYVLNIFHLCSFVCFVIYSVNNRSGYDRSQPFSSISHVSVQFHMFRFQKLFSDVISSWFCMVLCGEPQKTWFWDQKAFKSD